MNEEQYEPTHTAQGAVGGGSSTGAPGLPTGLRDQRSHYDTTKGVNPSTGASYSKSSAGGPTQNHQRPLSPSPARSDDRIVADEPLPHTASTAQRAEIQDQSRGSRAGNGIGKGILGAAASVHVSFCTRISRRWFLGLLMVSAGGWGVAAWGLEYGCRSGVWVS